MSKFILEKSLNLFAKKHNFYRAAANSYSTTKPPYDAKSLPKNCVVYDGSCPVCSYTVKQLKLPNVETIDARKNPDLVKELKKKGYDLDKGMLVNGPQGEIHFGADAVKEMSKQAGGVISWLVNSPWIKMAYPLMRAVRNSLIPESLAEKQAREDAESNNDKSNKMQ